MAQVGVNFRSTKYASYPADRSSYEFFELAITCSTLGTLAVAAPISCITMAGAWVMPERFFNKLDVSDGIRTRARIAHQISSLTP